MIFLSLSSTFVVMSQTVVLTGAFLPFVGLVEDLTGGKKAVAEDVRIHASSTRKLSSPLTLPLRLRRPPS